MQLFWGQPRVRAWGCSVALQIGRAGRDGSESYCHLFLDDADFLRLRSLAHSDGIEASNALALLEAVFAGPSGGQAGEQGGEGPLYGTVAVGEVAEQCDMKQEVMETLLSYLEVRASCTQSADCTTPAVSQSTAVATILSICTVRQNS